MDDDAYITLDEAQAILGLSLRQVRHYIRSGRLRSKKEGQLRFVVRDDAVQFAAERAAEERQPRARAAVPRDRSGLVDYLKQLHDDRLDDIKHLQDEMEQMAHRIGELEAENRMLREATPPPA